MPGYGKTHARGYGHQHQQERARWRPHVAAGRVSCARCGRWIPPGAPWDLGHDAARTMWTGPEHRRCNRSDGATRGNRMRGRARARTVASRIW